MAKIIDDFLDKKSWSGDEVGKALIASTIHDIKHQGDPDYEPLFSQSEFEKMENSLGTDDDYTVYGVYRDIYSSIIDAYNRGQGLFQQFYNGYSRYSNAMYACQQADEALKRAESYPLIMTQTQYDRYKKKAQKRLQSYQESFNSLFFYVLEKFIETPEEAPKNIREFIATSKEEPAANRRILETYNRNNGRGYYQLPDGRRSDKMAVTEWQKALKEHFIKTCPQNYDGKSVTAEEAYRRCSEERLLNAYKLFFNGTDEIKTLYKKEAGKRTLEISEDEESRLMEALEDMLGVSPRSKEAQRRKENAEAPVYSLQRLLDGFADGTEEKSVTWNFYKEIPKLTKHDVLTDCLGYYQRDEEPEKATEQFNEFKTDYPDLSFAVEAYIKTSVPKLKNLNPDEYYKDVVTWGELADLNIIGYKHLTEPDAEHVSAEFAKEKKIKHTRKNIAIIQNPTKHQMDSKGDYMPSANPIEVFPNLDSLANDKEKKDELEAYQNNLFKPALRFMYAFNTLMKIVGVAYKIEDMGTVQLCTTAFENQLNSFNNLIYIFYAEVYGDAEEKSRKRKIIKELFKPVDIEELKPAHETISKVMTELSKLGFTSKARENLKNFDRYISILTGEDA